MLYDDAVALNEHTVRLHMRELSFYAQVALAVAGSGAKLASAPEVRL